MEIFNFIVENYGGRHVERIFKSYLILSLIIKQLLFSLFMGPAGTPTPNYMENKIPIFTQFSAESHEVTIDEISIYDLVSDLLKIDSEKTFQVLDR